MNAVEVTQGIGPIVLGQPHSGSFVPSPIFEQLNDLGRQLLDTDWRIPELYDGLLDNLTVVRANFSRYVIDANRDPSGVSLYPGQSTTALVPLTSFDGEPIWHTEPSAESIVEREQQFHREYHRALQAEVERVKALHGEVVLYDCHSIRSEIPFLFDDVLPVLNVGNNLNQTCSKSITMAIEEICQRNKRHSYVINGRFRGGWTTRHYGKPDNGVHAIQMELAQRAYLKTEYPPFELDRDKATSLRTVLSDILGAIEKTVTKQQST